MRSISHYPQSLSSHEIYCCVTIEKSLYLSGSQIPHQFKEDKLFGPRNWQQAARTDTVSITWEGSGGGPRLRNLYFLKPS